MAILETKDLRKIYGSGENEVHALDGVSISVDEGEFVAVVGTSGSGKSTLLNMIGGLDRPTSGSVTIRGKDLLKMKDEELTIFRRRNIGFVFQNYNLLPVLNVYENIVYPIEIDGAKADTEFVRQIIHTLGLEKKLKNMPNNLSGGQQQRVAIARALATKPAIILADEPTGNLDSKTSMDVILLMQSISKQYHQTTIMITHNEEIAMFLVIETELFFLMGRLLIPSVSWLVVMLLLAPAISLIAVTLIVRGSAKAQSVEESQQAAVFLIIPLILLIAGQFTGVLLMNVWILLGLGAVCAILAWILLQKSMGRFTYEKLLQ